jgi:ribose 5-phosphate isomerase
MEIPEKLESLLKSIPGIVETGLFINMADTALIGGEKGIKRLKKV